MPFDNTHAAALDCMNMLLHNYADFPAPARSATPLNIQEELVLDGKRINETDAGRELHSSLQTTLDQTKKTLQDLLEQARATDDHEMARRIEKDIAVTENQLQRTREDIEGLNIPWYRRVYLRLPKPFRMVCITFA